MRILPGAVASSAPRGALALAIALALLNPGFGAAGRRPIAAVAPGRAAQLDHVLVVIMENHSYSQATRPSYLRKFVAHGVVFTQSFANTHPSQPNYMALWAGSTFGSHDDECPMPGSPFTANNLGHACEKAGLSWRAYSEALPRPGDAACGANGRLYRRKHAPWTNFSNLDHRNEQPFEDLEKDAADGRLPRLAFVVPDQCNDGHDSCGVSPMLASDRWLAAHLPRFLELVGPRGLVILTWDEDDYSQTNQILTVFAGGAVKSGVTNATHITHFTVCRAICEGLGIPPMNEAATEPSIAEIWAASPPSSPSRNH